MKFYEKYPQLRDRAFLSEMLVDTVYSTMALENQEVSKEKVEKIVSDIIKDKELQDSQFFIDKVS